MKCFFSRVCSKCYIKTCSFQKVSSHFAQWNAFSPLCSKCYIKIQNLFISKGFIITLCTMKCFFSSVCSKCYIKTCSFQKVLSHFAQWNAFSPVCTFSVTSRLVHFKRFSNILPIGMLFLQCVLLVLHQNLLISKGFVTLCALKCFFTSVCS